MVRRCSEPKNIGWKNYGGRGVTVCARWQRLENFLADMGERPTGKTLDRYPNSNGNYEPGNCRWATWEEQARNRRPSSRPRKVNREQVEVLYRAIVAVKWADRMTVYRTFASEWGAGISTLQKLVQQRRTQIAGPMSARALVEQAGEAA